jgi:hypothetical protein
MFNSPLQYCPICKQQVALDQTKDECAREQQCKAENCPLSHLFLSPAGADDKAEKPDSGSETRKKIEFYLP